MDSTQNTIEQVVQTQLRPSAGKRWVYNILHLCILALSLYLIITISIDTFKNIAFYKQPQFIKVQVWICVAFLSDLVIEFFMADHKWDYIKSHLFFLIVSIPYLWFIDYFGWHFSSRIEYMIQYIPLVRGGYALAIVVGWFTYNRATSLFITYVVTLLATIYFGSMVFYVFEKGINTLVVNYEDALWWGFMDATTVGSNIVAVTPVGRILSVLLAALGMMMFPIFTVYVTNLIQNRNKRRAGEVVPFALPVINLHAHSDNTTSTEKSAETDAKQQSDSTDTSTGQQNGNSSGQ